jgi:hypothetical protein
MNLSATTGSKNPTVHRENDKRGIDPGDFKQIGLYLLFPGGRRIVLTREKIEAFARAFEANLDQIPERIRSAVAFQACEVCPEKARAKFCHALPATLAFVEELDDFKSYDKVGAVYRGLQPGLAWVPETTMQEALQFVTILSLMYYCEVGKKYWKFFLGTHPLLSPHEMIARIYLNIYWDCQGDKQQADRVMQLFAEEITHTCRCQVKRLGLICKNDALMSAFVNTQVQIEYLAMSRETVLKQSFEEYLKSG